MVWRSLVRRLFYVVYRKSFSANLAFLGRLEVSDICLNMFKRFYNCITVMNQHKFSSDVEIPDVL